MRLVVWIQRFLLIVGLALLASCVTTYIYRGIEVRAELRLFESLRAKTAAETTKSLLPKSEFKTHRGLWSEKRVALYEQSVALYVDPPLAVLRILKVQLEVPVLEGTDDLTLNRGVGHIVGTGRPGEEGNIGIAGHRDGFFRVLKDVVPGDKIELFTARGTDTYTVDQIELVRPNDVSVLQPRRIRSLTLVTCYPFYFIGSAPQRYIVQASIADDNARIGSVKEARLETSAR